jgi:hypothetical protein
MWAAGSIEPLPTLGSTHCVQRPAGKALNRLRHASAPSPAMVGYAALYLLIALTVALYNFQERDL